MIKAMQNLFSAQATKTDIESESGKKAGITACI